MSRKRNFHRPYERVVRDVACQSGRHASKISLVVLHTTEGYDRIGISDLRGLGDYFNQPQTAASSHVGVDGEGHSAQYVPDSQKAWTQGWFNRSALSIEQIGFSAFRRAFWLGRNPQLRKTAKYIAYWSRKHDIPIRKGRVGGQSITRSGVIRHSELGTLGGNHGDPGRGYPMHRVLVLARWYRKHGW